MELAEWIKLHRRVYPRAKVLAERLKCPIQKIMEKALDLLAEANSLNRSELRGENKAAKDWWKKQTPAKRSESARKAALARWGKDKPDND